MVGCVLYVFNAPLYGPLIKSQFGALGVQCIQLFFSKTLFDFKKSISNLIELKFSGKTPNEVLYAPIYFWGVYFLFNGVVSVLGGSVSCWLWIIKSDNEMFLVKKGRSH